MNSVSSVPRQEEHSRGRERLVQRPRGRETGVSGTQVASGAGGGGGGRCREVGKEACPDPQVTGRALDFVLSVRRSY